MSTNEQLLHLRGIFQDTFHVIFPPSASYSIEKIVNCFPVAHQHVIIISQASAHLLYLPSQKVYWSIISTDPILAAALAPDQPLLALALAESTIIWDLSHGQIVQRLNSSLSEEGSELAFGRGGVLAVAPLHGGVQLWNVGSGQLHSTLMNEQGWYEGSPKSLAFSPDGTLLAVGHADASDVWVWQVANGSLLRMMDAHPLSHRIRGIAFTPDGKHLIGSEWSTDPEEGSMSIWEVSTGKRVGKLLRVAWHPAVSPDGQFVASVDEEVVSLWELAERTVRWQVENVSNDLRLVFSLDGHFLVGSHANGVTWWRVGDGQEVYRLTCAPSGQVRGMFARDGQRLVIRTLEGAIHVWDAASGQVLYRFPYQNPFFRGGGLSVDGERLVVWEDGSRPGVPPVYLVSPSFGGEYLTFVSAGEQRLECAACHETSKLLAAGCTDQNTGQARIALWQVKVDLPVSVITPEVQTAIRAQMTPIHHFVGHTQRVRCLLFSPQGTLLASGSDDTTVRLWKPLTREDGPVLQGHTRAVGCLAFSDDGAQVISGGHDGTVRVWDTGSGQPLQVLEGPLGEIVSVAIHPDGQSIAAADRDGRVGIWKKHGETFAPEPGDHLLPLLEHRAFSFKGEPIAPEHLQESLHFWTFDSSGGHYQLAQEHTQPLAVAFQPDGSLSVAGYCWGATVVWSVSQLDI